MMQRPTSNRITFIEAAYQAYDKLRDALGYYHIAKHTELIWDSSILCGWNQYYDEQTNRTYNKLYVEGTLVLVEIVDHNTGNKMIRTTNGDQWYGEPDSQGFQAPRTKSKTRLQTSWAA